MHATRCAFASPKVSLEVTLPRPPGVGLGCWQPQPLAKGCNNSLQVRLQIVKIHFDTYQMQQSKTDGLDGDSEEEAGARTIACSPADFI